MAAANQGVYRAITFLSPTLGGRYVDIITQTPDNRLLDLGTSMRIYLISPTHYNPDGSMHKTTRYWTSGLTLPYLKALTPPGHDVSFVDELFYEVDLERD